MKALATIAKFHYYFISLPNHILLRLIVIKVVSKILHVAG